MSGLPLICRRQNSEDRQPSGASQTARDHEVFLSSLFQGASLAALLAQSRCRGRCFCLWAKASGLSLDAMVFRFAPSILRRRRDQADRAISKAQLHALLRFHMPPIDVVVYHGSRARPGFEGGFPLRCFQRLSRPHIATRLCRWRDNRSTRGASIPVLSY